MTFLQSVLRYSAAHSDGTNQSPSEIREMSPEVFIYLTLNVIYLPCIFCNTTLTLSVKNGLKTH